MIGRGERAPDFALPRGDGQPVRFYGVVGGAPALLVLAGDGGRDATAQLAAALRDAVPAVDVHVVACVAQTHGHRWFRDPDGGVHRAYGASRDGEPVVVVLGADVRVADAVRVDDPAEAVAAVVAAVPEVPAPGSGARASRHAPVLLVPDALDAAWCQRLIDVWETSGAVQTGVESGAGDDRAEHADEQRKRRRDHTVEDGQLLRELTSHIGRRVMPELRKAFAYQASGFEGFKIGCYEAADGGFFDAHRDNLSPTTAHRRFALTLNLNDEYEGGELCFPEYGPDRYRPEPGEALVFSGSHLHEVQPVTRGRRFVLLSFLFGPEARRGR